MTTPTRNMLQSVMTDATVDTTLTMVASMVGLTKDMSTKIIKANTSTNVNEMGFRRQPRNLHA